MTRPEVTEAVDEALRNVGVGHEVLHFPWTMLVVIGGLFLVLVIEQGVIQYQENRRLRQEEGEEGNEDEEDEVFAFSHGHSHGGTRRSCRRSRCEEGYNAGSSDANDKSGGGDGGNNEDGSSGGGGKSGGGANGNGDKDKDGGGASVKEENEDSPLLGSRKIPRSSNAAENKTSSSSPKKAAFTASVSCSVSSFPSSSSKRSAKPILRAILLLFALSVHSLFEGLAFGLQSCDDEI